ncbi:MAG TPA: NAD(P)-binding domain-containing protein, partial [Burkholderiaceae bacterium]
MTRPTPANDSPAASASTSTAPRLAFVGGGNMASAVLGGLLQAGHPADRVLVVEPHAPQAEAVREKFRVRVETAGGPALAGADIVVWAVKPQVFAQAAAPCAPHVRGALQLSVMAGIRSDAIARATGSER